MADTVHVPFADLHAQYLTIKSDIDAVIADVIRTSAFIRGPYVDKFEAAFADMMNAKHCVSCANGTDSLYIAMHALGVKPGDEVIAPAHSWISTTETITQAGGKVVFCDTDPLTHTIDTSKLAALVTPRTVGVIPVHIYGQPADMDPIMAIAKQHGLWILEDCAQSHLARYKGRLVGTFGNAASFSFYPGKNLGAMGDAGAVTTNDPELAKRMAMFARHGGLTKGDHQIEGINSRLDGLQAAILSVKLPHLPKWTRARQHWANVYTERLSGIPGVSVPAVAEGREPVWHLYVIRHERRDALAAHLKSKGIQTVINYPTALPFLPCYAPMGHKPSDFPNAHRDQSRILSLPIFPEMTEAQIDAVVEAIRSFDGAAA
ncbi:MAG: DegT/DnrJ/EryC1/StrS family aminotransferase [Roseateles asaccharophilus]|uniref:dTDP-4-amino-4,6-dideoxygalactose transaminase n=1 Tax=Roseateles asaccharophilus TaxID=582607 RepID=A0A4V3CJ08_9BURK|nr:DegT/DnrJ/EryC1/StrS family aminotransferase [Roseateles asaccharophilus]MDN3545717.1 DegT/DnrJ/EryC1/StrS family aminotransferase [Roseateles asaccharophilus]TDP07585.1 dTDP-4-amino-4,6-dideoxygalactose transaminase [Roseateles asaccharophilus]